MNTKSASISPPDLSFQMPETVTPGILHAKSIISPSLVPRRSDCFFLREILIPRPTRNSISRKKKQSERLRTRLVQFHFHQNSVNLLHHFQLGIKFSGAYTLHGSPYAYWQGTNAETLILVNTFK